MVERPMEPNTPEYRAFLKIMAANHIVELLQLLKVKWVKPESIRHSIYFGRLPN